MTERTSRTRRWSALLAASLLAVMQPAPAPADGDNMIRRIAKHAKTHPDCGGGTGSQTGLFQSCDEFPLSLPITFSYNPLSSQVSGTAFLEALKGAADAWNYPVGSPLVSPFGSIISIAGTTTRGSAPDGHNVVSWGNPADCGAPGAAAVACVRYQGPNGAARHKITEIDIILSIDETWRMPSSIEVLQGQVSGNAAIATANWLDVQSALAHEFGHAIGLEHVGNGSPNFSDLTDIGKHMQTMYPVDYRGSTAKRTIEAGDLLGLGYVHDNVN